MKSGCHHHQIGPNWDGLPVGRHFQNGHQRSEIIHSHTFLGEGCMSGMDYGRYMAKPVLDGGHFVYAN